MRAGDMMGVKRMNNDRIWMEEIHMHMVGHRCLGQQQYYYHQTTFSIEYIVTIIIYFD